jgi:3-oxoacyl-[acyl-carrier protein] reductase
MPRDQGHEELSPRTDGFDAHRGVALVIGGSGTIGQAICNRFAELRARVVLTYASNRAGADRAVAAAAAMGAEATALHADLGDAGRIRELVDEVAAQHDGIHSVVLAASPINRQVHVSRLSSEHYRMQLAFDAGGLFDLAQASLPHLRETSGSITALTTVANRRFVLKDVLSSGPKAANEALLRAIAAEEGRFGVRANAVGVGILAEGMTDRLIEVGDFTEAELEIARQRIAMRRLGTASDIADITVFLASERARYITGQWIDVDGGYSV